jgi:hypothetical protein
MPLIESEIKLIEAISQTKVMAIALNHETLSDEEMLKFIEDYEKLFHLPATDVLSYGCQKLVQSLNHHFPKLRQKIKPQEITNSPCICSVRNLIVKEKTNEIVHAKNRNFLAQNSR